MEALKIRIYLLTLVLLLILSGITTNFAHATSSEFTITDYNSDITYLVSPAENEIIISSDNHYILLPIKAPVISCCANNGLVHILSYAEDGNNYYASYYSVDTDTYSFNHTIIPELSVHIDENRFTVDGNNNFYLVDSYNNKTVHRYRNGEITAFEFNSTIRQIMCLDGINTLVITSKGIFIIGETHYAQVSSVVPEAPCTYIGSGIIEDGTGARYTYENSCLYPEATETTEVPTTMPAADTNADICIEDECIIVSQGFTVAKLYKRLGITKSDLTVHKNDGSVLSQGTLGTGMKASFEGKTYSIVIYGEITGEGNINSRDLKLLMKYLTGENELSSLQKLSSDINQDGIICTKDLLLLSRMY